MKNLVESGAEHIHRTFSVTEVEAAALAAEYVDLIGAKGGDIDSFSTESFNALLTKQLGSIYQWRDPGNRLAWEKRQQDGTNGYNDYLASRRPSPFKRW